MGRNRRGLGGTRLDSAGAGPGAIVFARSMARQGMETGCAGVGGVAFLGVGVLGVAGILGSELMVRLLAGGMFGFFGLFMLVSAASALGRGTDPRVAEISPSGAWLPEMGFVPWKDLAEVRLERIRGVGGSDNASTRQYRRVGFVPSDPKLRASRSTGAAWRMAALYLKLVRSIAPEVRLGGDDPAPFGVSETEISKEFDRLLDEVRRHVTVGDAAESRARERAARWTAAPAPADQPAPDLATLDAALGMPGPQPSASSVASLVAAQPSRQPAASFAVPAIKPIEAILAILPVVAPLTFVIPVILPMIQGGGPQATMGFVSLGVVVAALAIPGLIQVIRLLRRALERRTDVARLRVGPDGMWTPAGGLMPWDGIRAIRTERAGWIRQIGRPQAERWQLVVEPSAAGAPSGTARSDELDAPFDDVLDLIRVYHPVVETS